VYSIMELVDYENPRSAGFRLRRRRLSVLRGLIAKIYAARGAVKILDVGGRRSYWRLVGEDLLMRNGVHITLLNSDASQIGFIEEQNYSAVVGDACNSNQFEDNQFDLVHSNSTIEHVGDWSRVEAFAREIRRLAPNYFVQTPYFWFPIEPHFLLPAFHWLPEGLRAKILMTFIASHKGRSVNIGDAMHRVQGARLLDQKQMQYLFFDAELSFEWIGPFPKSILAVRSG
jgi:hypothetical protein